MDQPQHQPRPESQSGSWANGIRDVLLVSMDKGQAPLFCGFLVIIVVLLRLDSTTLDALVTNFYEDLRRWQLIEASIGLIMAVIGVGYYRRAVIMIRDHTEELRLKQKTKVQKLTK